MKTALVYLCGFEDRHDYFLSSPPAGLMSVASYLEGRGIETALLNYSSAGYRRAVADIKKTGPSLVGVSLYTHNRIESIKFIRELKKAAPGVIVVAGGPHAGPLAEQLLKEVKEIDFVVRGEGERVMEKLARDVERGTLPPKKVLEALPVENLDTLPFAGKFSGRSLGVDPNEHYKVIITSRGCAYSCSFCCSPSFWGRRVRFRSAAHIADEIEYLRKTYGIIFFSIRDDNLTLQKKRLVEFCRLLVERKLYIMWNCQSRVDTVDEEMLVAMKRAGCEQVQFGVESGSERILARYDKKTGVDSIREAARLARRVGLYLFYYLMTGMEGETAADVKKTVALIRSTLPGDGIVSPVALYPGTRLYREAVKNRLDERVWFRDRSPGVYLRNDPVVGEWMDILVNELGMIRERSWYRAGDFAAHRGVAGDDCWVTDILEGDYSLDGEDHASAEKCYRRVMERHPENCWGYLRMGKSRFMAGDYSAAGENFTKVTRLVPNYYGGWLKLAESMVARGDRSGAAVCVKEAGRLNPYDPRIKNLKVLLNRRRSS